MSLQSIFPFDNSNNYNFDKSKIEVVDGKAKLKTISISKDWIKDFSVSSDYIYDSNKIEFVNGTARLKLESIPSQEFRQDCNSDTGFVYDNTKVYFEDGFIKQKNQRKPNCTCGATWTNSVNLSFGDGILTPTYNDGVTITNNRLDLTGGGTIRYSADKNADMQQVGAVRIKITPNYSGVPSSTMYFLKIAKSTSSNANIVTLYHSTNGNLYFMIKNYSATTLFQANLGNWSPTAGQTYRFLIVWDIDSGNSKVYIDGVQFGNTFSQTGVRDSNISLLEFSGDFYAEDLEIFTANPGASDYEVPEADYVETIVTLPEFIYNGPGYIVSLDNFYAADFDEIHYTVEGKYWNGSSWVTSNHSYSQSNDYSEINEHISSLTLDEQDSITIKAIFPNSNDQGLLNYIIIGYTKQAYIIDNPSIEIKESLTGTVSVSSWNSFIATITALGNDKVTFVLSDDNGNTWKYWDGNEWALSSGYLQSNTYSEINANLSSFPTSNGLKVKIYLHSDDGDSTPTISLLTINYNDNIYSTDNPIIYPNSLIRTDKIESLSEVSTKPTGTEIKYIIKSNDRDYYWNGNNWVISNGTYSQSNTITEINENLDSFPEVPSDVYIKIFLHTDDESVTPEIDQLTVMYDYAGSDRDSITICTVTGWITNIIDNVTKITSVPITVTLNKQVVTYKDNIVLMNQSKTFYPRSNGYFELKLVENDNMKGNCYYIVIINNKTFRIRVPNAVGANFSDILF